MILCIPQYVLSQTNLKFETHYYYGSILDHNNRILHLIQAHPDGILFNLSRKTFGEKEWQARFNYPEYGLSFHYQNNHNPVLGDLYSVLAYYNFFFFKRHMSFAVGQGIAYNSNPYNNTHNFRNVAYGSHFMPTTYFKLSYNQENIFKGIGLQAGLFLIHHSNATLKQPNVSTNTAAVMIGLNYDLNDTTDQTYKVWPKSEHREAFPFHYNLTFRTGVQEAEIHSGRYPFYNISAHIDKPISSYSTFQLGTELMLSQMRKKQLKWVEIVYPERNWKKDADYKRLGLFIGHELFINKLALETQISFYVYNQFQADSFTYQRVGLNYYFNPQLYTGVSLKTHFAKAEAMEFGVGIRI